MSGLCYLFEKLDRISEVSVQPDYVRFGKRRVVPCVTKGCVKHHSFKSKKLPAKAGFELEIGKTFYVFSPFCKPKSNSRVVISG